MVQIRKIMLLMIMSIFFISLASAELNDFAPVKQGDCVTIKQSCSSCTYVNLSVSYPNSSLAVTNDLMTSVGGGVWTYDFCNTTQLGRYDINGEGDIDGTATSFDSLYFDVTYSGIQFDTPQSILYIILFAILIGSGVLLLLFINKLPSKNNQDEAGRILSINKLKYLRPALWFVEYMLVVAVLYLSSNLAFAYLGEQLFAQIIFTLFRLTFMFAPLIVIVWIIMIFVDMYHDKEFQKMLNRGIFPQGKL